MVLQGNDEGLAPPFDASLYGASLSPRTPGVEYEIEYADCSAAMVIFSTSEDVTEILPEGIVPYSQHPKAGVLLTHYPFSTVGEYHEFLTVVQVEDLDGEMAYYIPYIYVTNDAAMAAGREFAGAPKKMAEMDLDTEGTVVDGTLAREGRDLFSVSTVPEKRATGGIVDAFLPDPTPLLSIRHLPPIEGGDGCTQLVKWYADIDFHADGRNRRKIWTGPTDAKYPAESVIDPVHRVPIEDQLAGMYAEFDMALGVTEVHREWEL